MRSRSSMLASALACAALWFAAANDANAAVTRTQLKNGLDVVLNPEAGFPFVVVGVVYDVGSRDNPRARSGLAHLSEHLMFRQTGHIADNMFFAHLQRAGVSEMNGITQLDRTEYYEVVPMNALRLALWLESERMASIRGSVRPELVAAERATLKNERATKRGYGLRGPLLARLFPENHPYHRAGSELEEDVARIEPRDVQTFLDAYYVPNNAHLVVSGMFDPTGALDTIRTYFERVPRGSAPKGKLDANAATTRVTTNAVLRWNVATPLVAVAWRSPSWLAVGDAELDLAATILCGRLRSRYSRSFSCAQESHELGSMFTVIAAADAKMTTGRLFDAIDAEVAGLAGPRPVSVQDVESARDVFGTRRFFESEKLMVRSSRLMSYLHVPGGPDFTTKDLDRYWKVTPTSVEQVVAEVLRRETRLDVLVQPTGEGSAPDLAPEEVIR